MILLKLAILSIALLYSTVALAQGKISDKELVATLKCHEVQKTRCLEVQEYGQEFVGPQIDESLNEAQFVDTTRPTIRELVCCEKSTSLRESVVGHIFNEMLPDQVIISLLGQKVVKHKSPTSKANCRNISSVNNVYNDDRFVGPKIPDYIKNSQ
ncbi:hypothetical protein [Halobacteriovorax sp.]|uniref:hypothetical protein n=1 Tax=Halobacteriovorax sp. TaxID=2020862 RepID=UPI003AF3152C